jgi:hypothetical protein
VTRATLSLLSQLIAFLLFVALRAALSAAFDDGAAAADLVQPDENVGIVTTLIFTAVFFTIVHLTGSFTTEDAGAQRIAKMPVSGRVWRLVLVEALLLCVVGSCVGFGLTILFEPGSAEPFATRVGRLATSWDSMVMGVATALVIGSVLASPRVWFTRRMLGTEKPSESERVA